MQKDTDDKSQHTLSRGQLIATNALQKHAIRQLGLDYRHQSRSYCLEVCWNSGSPNDEHWNKFGEEAFTAMWNGHLADPYVPAFHYFWWWNYTLFPLKPGWTPVIKQAAHTTMPNEITGYIRHRDGKYIACSSNNKYICLIDWKSLDETKWRKIWFEQIWVVHI